MPDGFLSRLEELASALRPQPEIHRTSRDLVSVWCRWFRWLAPATAVLLAVTVFVSKGGLFRNLKTAPTAISNSPPARKADAVESDQQLANAFDTMAVMANEEPVRMRVHQWMDEVTLRDSATGVEVQQRIPRIKVVPVSYAG